MRTRSTVAALSTALILCSSLVFASPAKTYQVTGPVLEVRSDMIAVQKGERSVGNCPRPLDVDEGRDTQSR